ncbi:hypothetical protein JQS43_03045 [Natronosporangium hydrolyticum]|uniref:Uncharacterized protein n=1 Tax=Natronosporangium hydrolyticum TaxID=2811111 RepID=A0A895YL16_9ACTN|nr:hypothetical protein [Natronosporangium hydrolyticum]QSB15356.1 hypothetical protein JQS43_03045 [Natronosporangium hydrolyticum]
MSRSVRNGVAITLVAAVLSACGQADEAGEFVADTPSSTPDEAEPLVPDWFPEAFPPPPEGVEFGGATLRENVINHGGEITEDLGTLLSRSVQLVYSGGSDAEIAAALDHYRTAFPDAGWEIVLDEELDPAENPSVRYPGWRLVTEHADSGGSVTVSQREDHVEILARDTASFPERAPYSAHPPLIELPEWYELLPELPAELWRYSIEARYQDDLRTPRHVIEYHENDAGRGEEDRGVEIIDHHRDRLPAGWLISDEEDSLEEEGQEPHTWQRRQVGIEVDGDGLAVSISTRQSTDLDGEWGGVVLTIIVDG